MKKVMLLLIGAAMVTTATLAQAPAQKDHKKDRAEWEQKIKTDLKLTADQSVKFDALNKEYNGKIDVIAQDAELSQDAQKEKKMTLKKEKETRLLEILTPEQQALYKEIIEKKKKDMETKPAGGR